MSSLNTSNEPQLRVQINQIDYTVEPPGELDNTRLPRAPVVRIFGTSSLGKTACVHIHQVYPYFYVEYPGELNPIHVKRYTTTLANSLNHAIALSFKRNPDSPRSQYVRAILLVKGIHFYGFHSTYSPFLKIYLADPSIVSRVVAILQSGTVMATPFRVFESHLSFLLQFMCDFNLYGCGWIDLGEVYLRGVEQLLDNEESSVNADFKPSPYYCQSRLPLEVDVIAPHILNRTQLHMRGIHHKLEIPEPQLSTEPLISSVRELWEDERRRRSAQGLNPSPEMPLDPSEASRKPGGGWIAEQRWWEELHERIRREQEVVPADDSSSPEWKKWTMSTFESIEALWDREYRTWKPGHGYHTHQSGEGLHVMSVPASSDPDVDVQVDADLLSSQEMVHVLQATEEERGDDDDVNEIPDDFHDEIEELATDGEQEIPQRGKSPDNPFLADASDDIDFTLPDLQNIDFEAETESPYGELQSHRKPTSNFAMPMRRRAEHAYSRATSTELRDCSSSRGTFTPSDLEGRPVKRRKIDKRRTPDYVSTPSTPIPCAPDIGTTIRSFDHHSHMAATTSGLSRYEYKFPPPTTSDLCESLDSYDLPQKIYRQPYYSRNADVPRKTRVYGGMQFRLKSDQGIADLEDWKSTSRSGEAGNLVTPAHIFRLGSPDGWEYASYPPSVKQTKKWLKYHHGFHSTSMPRQRSQIEGPTIKDVSRMKPSSDGNIRESQAMTILSLEVFVPSDDGKAPDHQRDEIVAAFYAFQKDESEPVHSGIIATESERLNKNRIRPTPIEEVPSELDLLNTLIDVVIGFDPDILTGWEVQKDSWGYCNARAMHYGYELTELVSRAPSGREANDYNQWELRHTSTVKVAGRHVLNGWRILRSEQNLHSYTLENVAFHVLRKRVPHFSQSTLTKWHRDMVPAHLATILWYFSSRTAMTLDILNKMEIISKTAEFARVFGVDFFSVISRGSQFKVESFMLRIAKPENYVLLSPSKSDVGKQNAAECMPLIMEPTSAFYASPLLVLDFQSLYPSVMIAYNYCYSTCLGRVRKYKGRNKFGVVDLDQPAGILSLLKEHIHIAPNGVMYVKPTVRKGLLRRMLTELLETRVMVKHAMKSAKDNKSLLRVLDARQLGLKYISNVTYGYTSATYSGRMPAVEIADSIVQSGRETLEKAISVINSTKKWGAQVVYGDTDSVFVHLPGKTREQAFRIGTDIADTITALNPSPIKLKFEKVYHPCVLMAKKRYVGFKYESPDQVEPTFDAKGIETVRRDGVLAQQKMTEKCLKILFRSQDLSEIKSYCYRSWTKLMEDRASIQDFIFHKEVKMGTYSDKGLPPPGVVVAARRMLLDPGNEPQYGERVPYVIVRGPPGSRLVDRAMDPLEFMQDSQLRLDATYYITRVLIPPLERILNLVGADVRRWFNEMPKPSQIDPTMSPRKSLKFKIDSPSRPRLNDHFFSTRCHTCFRPASQNGLCDECRSTPQETSVKLGYRIRSTTDRLFSSHLVCSSCTMSAPSEPAECNSLDCAWFFARKKAERQAQFLPTTEESYRDAGVQPPVLYIIDEDSD